MMINWNENVAQKLVTLRKENPSSKEYGKLLNEIIKYVVDMNIKRFMIHISDDNYDDTLQNIFLLCHDGMIKYTGKTIGGKKTKARSYIETIIRGGLRDASVKQYKNRKTFIREGDSEYPVE